MTIADTAHMLEAALGTVSGAKFFRLGDSVVCPALVLGPPQLEWQTGCVGPTSARFLVYAVVDVTDRSVEQLWELIPLVAEAVDETDAVVVAASPGVFIDGVLPSYLIQVEAPL